ncbi:MAG: nucleotide exchange factor GrpE [Gemmatimonadetes bacterium]|nr:nucleotide exchange factor GrpE [Gemmatimonadota bacterium]MYG15820.1 nucleotide exchange factor GrpE [Gemmatimonadota bacterium]
MKSAFRFRSDHPYMGQLFSWIGMIALVTSLSMFYIWHQDQTRSLKREILQLEHQKEAMEKKSAYLHVRIVRLAEQLRNETVAMHRFELEHAAVGQVVVMDAMDTAVALAVPEPDVRAIAGEPSEDALILASFRTARVDTR